MKEKEQNSKIFNATNLEHHLERNSRSVIAREDLDVHTNINYPHFIQISNPSDNLCTGITSNISPSRSEHHSEGYGQPLSETIIKYVDIAIQTVESCNNYLERGCLALERACLALESYYLALENPSKKNNDGRRKDSENHQDCSINVPFKPLSQSSSVSSKDERRSTSHNLLTGIHSRVNKLKTD